MPEERVDQILRVDLAMFATQPILVADHEHLDLIHKPKRLDRSFRNRPKHIGDPVGPGAILANTLEKAIIFAFVRGDEAAEVENGNVEQSLLGEIEDIDDTPDAAVAVGKRMDALKLVMDDRHFDQRIEVAASRIVHEPLQLDHETLHVLGFLWRDVDELATCFVLERGPWLFSIAAIG